MKKIFGFILGVIVPFAVLVILFFFNLLLHELGIMAVSIKPITNIVIFIILPILIPTILIIATWRRNKIVSLGCIAGLLCLMVNIAITYPIILEKISGK